MINNEEIVGYADVTMMLICLFGPGADSGEGAIVAQTHTSQLQPHNLLDVLYFFGRQCLDIYNRYHHF
jgi:hypothetical protein